MRKAYTKTLYQHWLTCDRCGRKMEMNGEHFEWAEAVTIRFRAQPDGPFQEGQWHALDLCQHCLKQTLGRYLRIIEDSPLFRRDRSTRPRHTHRQQELQCRFEADWIVEPFLDQVRETGAVPVTVRG